MYADMLTEVEMISGRKERNTSTKYLPLRISDGLTLSPNSVNSLAGPTSLTTILTLSRIVVACIDGLILARPNARRTANGAVSEFCSKRTFLSDRIRPVRIWMPQQNSQKLRLRSEERALKLLSPHLFRQDPPAARPGRSATPTAPTSACARASGTTAGPTSPSAGRSRMDAFRSRPPYFSSAPWRRSNPSEGLRSGKRGQRRVNPDPDDQSQPVVIDCAEPSPSRR